ncbi:hypothetical protein PJI17_00310 [Mycobacterium kansasii]|uniref:Uncharacterized protein n=1 Tax=Mycobacterium kansasii TaxID=1768 RepID=A0A1V3WNB5_MYCKA|nr:hypothetical protein I547_4658 [Mycobacterium kansasii 824]KEP40613.1 hypothetical protein MKSMC1_42330 [Mycobacterium kansasii]OOK68238.1 hypothetical protein BZL29_6897 [Mycobacterium kansasii]OOK71717.1 hypothetical protein BZL30_5572 [Mycobacterium kansasii]
MTPLTRTGGCYASSLSTHLETTQTLTRAPGPWVRRTKRVPRSPA